MNDKDITNLKQTISSLVTIDSRSVWERYSDHSKLTPLEVLGNCIYFDAENFAGKILEQLSDHSLLISFYVYNYLYYYRGKNSQDIDTCVADLMSIIYILNINTLGFKLNTSTCTWFSKILRSLSNYGWVPCDFDAKNQLLIVKNTKD